MQTQHKRWQARLCGDMTRLQQWVRMTIGQDSSVVADDGSYILPSVDDI